MQRNDFLRAFAALGGRLSTLAEIVVAGGSALVLLGIVDRSTADADAVSSRPKLSTLPVTSPPSPTSWAWPRAGSTTASPPTAICSLTGLSIAHRDARYVRPAHRARAWPRGSDPHEDGGRPATSTTSMCSRQLRRMWRSSINNSHASIKSRHATHSASNSISSSTAPHPNAHDGPRPLHHPAG